MRHIVALAMGALLVVSTQARAQLSAEFSATTVAPGEVFQLSLSAEGSSVSVPVLPEAPDFVFMNAASPSVATGLSTTFINGSASVRRTRSWTYNVHIDKEGTFSLPPIRVQIDSKDYATEPISITVSNNAPRRPARTRRSPFGGLDPFSILQPQQRGQNRAATSAPQDEVPVDKLLLFDIAAEKTEVYQGEAIIVRLSYAYVSSGVSARADEPKLPAIQGFFIGDGELMPDTRFDQDGLNYKRRTRVFKLFPMEAGEFTIPAVEWPVQVSRLGIDDRVVVKKSEAIPVRVKPLPPAPPSFTGAVGEFQLTSALPSTELIQGTPVDFVVSVRGVGNPAAISAPEIPAMDWAHISSPSIDLQQAQAAGALKIFKYTLTPLEAGAHAVPAIKINYFSPKSGAYLDVEAPAIAVNLRKAVDAGPMVVVGATSAASTGAKVMTELHPIIAAVPDLGPERSGVPMTLAVLLFPPLAYAGLLLQVRRRRRLQEDPEFARAYFARSKSAKRLANVRGAAEPGEALFRAVAGFVADTLSVPEAGMTSADARRVIAERGLPVALADNVGKILRACERARYAGAPLPEAELLALLDAAVQAMDQLDAAVQEGKKS